MKIEIYEKALCCETGVCGASVDPELLRITALVTELKAKGIDIERYNLSSKPEQFVKNAVISDYIKKNGVDNLPLTVFKGEIIKEKDYLTNAELENLTGIKIGSNNKNGGCCCGKKGCC